MRRPRFIAEQARHARGVLGRVIAFIMARETMAENQRAVAALDLRADDHVIDIGCGPGRGLTALAARARDVVGVDPSNVMVETAIRQNRALVSAGKVKVMIASVYALPFPGAAFDKALCVHVVYFWNDLPSSFGEIARVLKPGGRLVLVFRTDADQAAVAAFPADVYHFRARADVIGALRAAGFEVDNAAEPDRDKAPTLLVATKRGEAATTERIATGHNLAH
jgi:ubiquinone/menaquinone biosynthesis C-methylase UbiE